MADVLYGCNYDPKAVPGITWASRIAIQEFHRGGKESKCEEEMTPHLEVFCHFAQHASVDNEHSGKQMSVSVRHVQVYRNELIIPH